MSTCVEHGVEPLAVDHGDPLAVDRGDPRTASYADPGVAELGTAFLRARVRDTTVRLSLAMFQAREYGQVWGRDAEARRWAASAEQLRAELDALDARLAAADAQLSPGELPPAA